MKGKGKGQGQGKDGRESVTGAFLPRENNDGPAMAQLPTKTPPPPAAEPKKGGGKGKGNVSPSNGLVKPSIADTIKLKVYADNWFMLYVNGRLAGDLDATLGDLTGSGQALEGRVSLQDGKARLGPLELGPSPRVW